MQCARVRLVQLGDREQIMFEQSDHRHVVLEPCMLVESVKLALLFWNVLAQVSG